MQIFYFTRTGTCERIAQEIAQSHGVEALKFSDGQNWQGGRNFLRAGAAAARGDTLEVMCDPLTQNGDIILVFPVWAGRLPPAVRGFMALARTNQVQALAISGATGLKDSEHHLFSTCYDARGKNPTPPAQLLGSHQPQGDR